MESKIRCFNRENGSVKLVNYGQGCQRATRRRSQIPAVNMTTQHRLIQFVIFCVSWCVGIELAAVFFRCAA